MMKERRYSLDILRILACVAVLSYHMPKESAALKAVDFCLITPSLAIFFMLTGFLTSAPSPAEGGLWQYYKKKIVHLGVPLYLFTVFYGFVYFQQPADLFCADGLRYVGLGARQSIVGVFSGPVMNQLWFLYDILAVYIIWPFVKAGLDAIGEKGRRKLLVLIFFLQLVICVYFLKKGDVPYFKSVIYLTGWLLYPILGSIAKDEWLRRYDRVIFIAGGLCAVLNAAMCVTEKFLGASVDVYSFSLLMLIEALAIFRAFLRIDIKKGKVLVFLSERTFTVYLLGAFTTFKLEGMLRGFFAESVPGMLLSLVILIVVTFALAAAVDLVLLKNIERFLLFVIGKAENFASNMLRKN